MYGSEDIFYTKFREAEVFVGKNPLILLIALKSVMMRTTLIIRGNSL